ncbi:VP2 [Norovirus GII/Hu/JP/2002/GII.P12_GII.13/Saitama/T80]|uniref:VP2 n=1 Tax=Norovirus GII/Hu/JP/2002/GII.P12_GII.13/Saitama/T80 TaxID=1529915 RepID=A0A076JAF0_NORV|nr:VP2 [Norovirus GII/Hu/JP/2002/GII.P12_GII.13/Saitama/T80]
MAGAFIAGLAGDMLTSAVSSLTSAGANAINQKLNFDYNKQLQNASFQHDKEMLQAQIDATKKLQSEMIAIKHGVLTAGGFSPADAARGAVNAPMTRVLDWSGTRYYAPNSVQTTSYSGQFTPSPVHRVQVKSSSNSSQRTAAPSSIRSLSTQSTSVTGSTSLGGSSATSSSSRTADWVQQQRALSPYMHGALQTAYVTPPSSRASSVSSVSTVPKGVLDSWTPVFNTRRQPLFAHLRKRGESQA